MYYDIEQFGKDLISMNKGQKFEDKNELPKSIKHSIAYAPKAEFIKQFQQKN